MRRAADKRLDLVSYGAADRQTVDQLAQRLASEGVTLVTEPDTLQTPGGGYGFRFFDLDGRTVEVSADVAVRAHRRIEEKEDIPVRLSHVVLNSPEPEKTRAFYEKHLGFRLSDTLNHPQVGDIFYFMRCSPQHHSMAIARGPHVSLQHVSFELRGIDEYMRGTGRLMRAGCRKIWGPGRHRAGENTFTYFLDPSGNTMEYTTELEALDEDAWHPHVYDTAEPATQDVWGTANPMRTGSPGRCSTTRTRGCSCLRRCDLRSADTKGSASGASEPAVAETPPGTRSLPRPGGSAGPGTRCDSTAGHERA